LNLMEKSFAEKVKTVLDLGISEKAAFSGVWDYFIKTTLSDICEPKDGVKNAAVYMITCEGELILQLTSHVDSGKDSRARHNSEARFGKFESFGGRIEKGENSIQCALREFAEESGFYAFLKMCDAKHPDFDGNVTGVGVITTVACSDFKC